MAAAAAEGVSVSSTVEAQPQMQRRIEFHPARRPFNGVLASLGEFRLETLNPVSSAMPAGGGACAEVEAVAPRKWPAGGDLYEHGLDPELSFRVSFQKIGAGLENLGNTCYLNSVLQCLTYTQPFAAYLQSGKHKSTCRAAGFCAMCALQNHVTDALRSTGKILRPFHFVKNLRYISRNFRNSRQEDAHEYMVNLLESMHKCCLPYGVPSESPSAYEKSQVHKIFGGQLRSQVKCMQCSYCSNTFDPFLDLSLEIDRADSLLKALAHFTAMELLDGGERQYQCQRCKEKVKAFKRLTIHKAPYVLTIHLKRFGSIFHGEKISKKVEYGPTLDLNPFISDPHNGGYKYTLYGVLVHAGWTTHSGHYFCYVRTSTGMWYSLDDNQVTQVSEKTVLSREAYMLFYVRDRTFAIKRPVEIAPKPDNSASANGNQGTPLVERKLSTTVYGPVKVKHDRMHKELIRAVDTSTQHAINNEVPLVQVNNPVETKGSCLQTNGNVFANGHQKAVSIDPAESLPSIDLKLPSGGEKKDKATNESAQGSTMPQRIGTDHFSTKDDHENVLRQSNTMNASIPKEAAGTVLVEYQDNGHDKDHDFKNCSSILQCQNGGESFLKLLETKPFNSLQSSTAVCCVQQGTPPDIITENLPYSGYQTEVKPGKPRKSSLAEGLYFGRKQLFFVSLHIHKKKQKRIKKHLRANNKMHKRIVNGPLSDSHGASTSETVQAIDVGSRHPHQKHSHSTTYRKFQGKEDFDSGSCSFHQKEIKKSMNGILLETSDRSSRICSIVGDTCVNKKEAEEIDIQNCSVNLLISSLKETIVAKWDDKDFQAHLELEENPKRNIGHVLDQWDEDYDKGKRKKVKKSRQCLDVVGHNPFQKTADFMSQQKMKIKVKRKRSGR